MTIFDSWGRLPIRFAAAVWTCCIAAQIWHAANHSDVVLLELVLIGLETIGLVSLVFAGPEQPRLRAPRRRPERSRRAADRERDHELANGLAALAGIAFLAGPAEQPPNGVDRQLLRSAVQSELTRLQRMLLAPDSETSLPAGLPQSYDVGAVLHELAALRRVTGLLIDVQAEAGLRVLGDGPAFAQAVTNLLANSQRHAPGSPVSLLARRRDAVIEVQVRDEGPRAPATTDTATTVMATTVQTSARAGKPAGIGLTVTERLLRAQGGTLQILPPGPGRPGFVVRLTLPA